jgi:hypothetical protein
MDASPHTNHCLIFKNVAGTVEAYKQPCVDDDGRESEPVCATHAVANGRSDTVKR